MGYKQLKKDFPDFEMEGKFHEAKKKLKEEDKELKEYGIGKKLEEKDF